MVLGDGVSLGPVRPWDEVGRGEKPGSWVFARQLAACWEFFGKLGPEKPAKPGGVLRDWHLPPLEYIDFLDQMMLLYEQKRISSRSFNLVLMEGNTKHGFLAVNYNHPRVAAILQKAIALKPTNDESLKICLQKMADGSLADNYLTNMPKDAPPPETLPGIKLKRPWGSLIKKYERVTGKKLPSDPDFPDEDANRPERRLAVGLTRTKNLARHPSTEEVIGCSLGRE